jgi:XrtJ-associated TM-motif-TM protein
MSHEFFHHAIALLQAVPKPHPIGAPDPAAHPDLSGCADSPEAATNILMAVGFAGLFYGTALARRFSRRRRILDISTRLLPAAAAACVLLALSGCALESTSSPVAKTGVAISGSVHGGQQPLYQSRVYLMAAATSGYGAASQSLLTSGDGTDSVGTYVLTNLQGGFSTTNYSCTQNTQVYILALGGNPSSGANSAIGLMAILGNCPAAQNFDSLPTVQINEATTVAAAYAIAGYAVDSTHVASSGTAAAQTGIANAFANAANLVSISTGQPLATTPNSTTGNVGTVPQEEINTLADVMATCVNTNDSSGSISSNCSSLFALTKSAGTSGTTPSDTATSMINIAHNPWANVSSIYPMPLPTSPYAPALPAQPNDWTIAIAFTAGGIKVGSLNTSEQVAIDGSGNAWIANPSTGTVTELSPLGVALTGASGLATTCGGRGCTGVAIDLAGYVWIVSEGSTGSVIKTNGSSSASYPTGGSYSLFDAIDGSGNVWVTNYTTSKTSYLNGSTGAAIGTSPFAGGNQSGDYGIAIDSTGNAWVANSNASYVTRITSAGTATGFSVGGATYDVAIDASSNVWATILGNNKLAKLSNGGSALATFSGGGLSSPDGMSIDGNGNVWVADLATSARISEFNNSGTAITSSTGYQSTGLSSPDRIAVDGSGNVWVTNGGNANVTEFIGAATPVMTPLAAAVKNNMIGARP